MTQAQLRPAIPTDFISIVALERATEFAPHWPAATYAAILDTPAAEPRRCIFAAMKAETLAGFAVGLMLPPPGESTQLAELESVVVSAASRRLGIGRALCHAVLDWSRAQGATEIVLEVRAASTGPIALYTALGFTQTGRRPRYYRNPEDDALAMRLPLS
jgi:ribosomal-protein-alanine N-acetyltransferase